MMTQLELYTNGENEVVNEMLKMLQAYEVTKMNFVFVLEVICSKSNDDIAQIKSKLVQIKEVYRKVTTIDDISTVPVKYVLMLIYSKVLPLLKRVVKESFQQNFSGDFELVTSEIHVERIRIAVSLYFLHLCISNFWGR